MVDRERFVGASETEVRQSQVSDGAVEISTSALAVALLHVRAEKESALDEQEWEAAVTWRVIEKDVMRAIAGSGLSQPD